MNESKPANSKNQNDRLILVSSIGTTIYFAGMISTYHLKIDNQVLRFVNELLTIPVVFLLIVLLVMSVIGLFRTRKKFTSLYFYSLLILISAIVMLVIFT
jgi:ABC-type proline/glycine betaine transport system permease subunit